jgi:hypothetical protein
MDAEKWKEIRNKAREKTDGQFASEASGLTRLTDEEIKAIAPAVEDREKLAQLMEIVTDATRSNQEKATALKNINGLAEMAIQVVGALV